MVHHFCHGGIVGSKNLLAEGECAIEKFLGIIVLSLMPVGFSEIAQSPAILANCEGPLQKHYGFAVSLAPQVRSCKIAQVISNSEVSRAERLLLDRQSAFVV